MTRKCFASGAFRPEPNSSVSIVGDQEKAMNGKSISVWILEIGRFSLHSLLVIECCEALGDSLTIPPARIPPAL